MERVYLGDSNLYAFSNHRTPTAVINGHQRQADAEYIGNALWSEVHLRLPYTYQQYEADRLNQKSTGTELFFLGGRGCMEPSIFGSATA